MSKKNAGDKSPVNYGESASEVMILTAAAMALLECRSALVEGQEAARASHEKHGGFIARELAQALQTVGSYTTNEHERTSLHVAVINGDAATVEVLVAGPMLIDITDSNGATPLDLIADDTCRGILEHHAALYASIAEDPTTLVAATLAHCATLSASEEPLPATVLSLRAYHLDPCFLWAPPMACAAVFAWAQRVFVAQLAATIQPFEKLPDDCAGDVLEFFGMTHTESELIAKHCSSLEARAWVRKVVASAVVVTQAKATADLVPAAQEGDLATVQECLSKKANIDVKAEYDNTALMAASARDHTAIVQLLVNAGADKEAKDKGGYTVLMNASYRGQTASVRVLVEAGADKEAKNDLNGVTALMRASQQGHTTCAQVLVEAGADKEAKDKNGTTALMFASWHGHPSTAQLLLEAGSNKDDKDKNGRSALIWASWYGQSATAQVLLEAGADKEAKDKFGRTALIWASWHGHTATAQVLLEAGANKDDQDNDGKTALVVANQRGNPAVVALLKK